MFCGPMAKRGNIVSENRGSSYNKLTSEDDWGTLFFVPGLVPS